MHFGSANKGFGSSGFGSSSSGGFGSNSGGGGAFGSSSSPFGSNSAMTTPNRFGSNTGVFGSSPSGNTGGTAAFGSSSGFGGGQNSGMSSFGSSGTSGFGQNKPAFGSAFGSSGTGSSPFGGGGSSNTGMMGGGAAATGSGSIFSTPPSGFGQSSFGGNNQTSAFGSSAGNSGFGNNTGTAFSSMGTSAFGQKAAASTFAQSGNTSAFGTSSMGNAMQPQGQVVGFGGASNAQQASSVGSGEPAFQPKVVEENTQKDGVMKFQKFEIRNISAMDAYAHKSPAEIRLEDYRKAGKAPVPGNNPANVVSSPAAAQAAQQAQTTPSGFGSSSFGQTSSSTTGFGSGAFGSGSGQTVQSGFGQQSSSPFASSSSGFGNSFGGFGSNNNSSTFGKSTTGTTGFGTAGGSTFGKSNTTGFGTGSATSTFGGGGTAFGSSTTGSSAFGSPNQGSSSSGFNFGGSFGGNTGGGSTSGFNFGNSTAQTQNSAFGGSSTSGFGGGTTGGAFGSRNKPATGTGFGFGGNTAFGQSTNNTQSGFKFGSPNAGLGSSTFGTSSSALKPFGGSSFGGSAFGMGSGSNTQSGFNFGGTKPNTGFGLGLGGGSGFGTSSSGQSGGFNFGGSSNTGFGTGSSPFGMSNSGGLGQNSSSMFGFNQNNMKAAQPDLVAGHATAIFGPNNGGVQDMRQKLLSAQRLLEISTDSGKSSLITGSSLDKARSTDYAVTPQSYDAGVVAYKAPSSGVKVKPRGLSGLATQSLTQSGGSPHSSLLSPDKFLNRSAKRLVINPTTPETRNGPASSTSLAKRLHDVSARIEHPRIENGGAAEEKESGPPPLPTSSLADAPLLSIEEQRPEVSRPTPVRFSDAAEKNQEQPEETEKSSAAVDAAAPHLAPILTKPNYHTTPDVSILKRMTAMELSHVERFCIYRPGVGSIEWKVEVDLRGLNLDELVRIEGKEVSVYELEEEAGTKPPTGVGLNCPARITIENVFPPAGATPEKVEKFKRKIEKAIERTDADLIGYHPDTGVWIFDVKHFSKYGLADSDDESDENGAGGTSSQKEKAKGKADANANAKSKAKDAQKDKTNQPADKVEKPLDKESALRPRRPFESLQIRGPSPFSPGKAIEKDARENAMEPVTEVDDSVHMAVSEAMDTADGLMFEQKEPLNTSIAAVAGIDAERAQGLQSALFSPSRFVSPMDTSALQKSILEIGSSKKTPQKSAGKRFSRKVHVMASPSATTKPVEESSRWGIDEQASVGEQQESEGVLLLPSPPLRRPKSSRMQLAPTVGLKNKKVLFSTDPALVNNRSFRVGWGRNGQFVHSGRIVLGTALQRSEDRRDSANHFRLVIEKIPALVDDKSPSSSRKISSLDALLSTHLKCARKEDVSEIPYAVPKWRLSKGIASGMGSYLHLVDNLHLFIEDTKSSAAKKTDSDWAFAQALLLMNALWGQEKSLLSRIREAMPNGRTGGFADLKEDNVTDAFALLPPCDSPDNSPENISHYALYERRCRFLADWLRNVNLLDVPNRQNFGISSDEELWNCLWDLVSRNSILEAAELANKHNLLRLSMMLPAATGDAAFKDLLNGYLVQVLGNDAIKPHIQRLYGILSGNLVIENAFFAENPAPSLSSGRLAGWLHRLQIEFVGADPSDTPAQVFQRFNEGVARSECPPPLPHYLRPEFNKNSCGYGISEKGPKVIAASESNLAKVKRRRRLADNVNGRFCVLWHLLDLGLNADENMDALLGVLDPLSSSRDVHDYKYSFFLYQFIEGLARKGKVPEDVKIRITQALLQELSGLGIWHWAVYVVTVVVDDDETRLNRVFDLLCRFATDEHEATTAERCAFVVNSVGVDARLVDLARAQRFYVDKKFKNAVEALVRIQEWDLAQALTVSKLAHRMLLGVNDTAAQLFQLLGLVEAHTSSPPSFYYRFLNLLMQIQQLPMLQLDKANVDAMLFEAAALSQELEDGFSASTVQEAHPLLSLVGCDVNVNGERGDALETYTFACESHIRQTLRSVRRVLERMSA